MTPRALRSLWPLLALACACDASWQGAPTATFPARYELSLTGPTAPFRDPAPLITAQPDPPDGTLEVRFALDGVVQSVDLTAPYSATLDLAAAWGGPRRLTATARRADGAVAHASLDLDYDPLGPFVTVVSPAAGTRVAPAGGALEVSFLASDPYGIAAGAVQIGDAAPVAIPLPGLALTVPVPPTSAELPATGALSYWLDDTTGNRTQGTVPFVQTHERFRLGLSGGGAMFALPGGRLAVLDAAGGLRVLGADGKVAWTKAGGEAPILEVFAAAGGDLVITRHTGGFSEALADVERLHADGTPVWSWPAPGLLASQAVYVPATDALLALRRTADFLTMVAVLVDAGGVETELLTAGTAEIFALAATPAGASPPGVAVAVSTHVSVFDPSGAPAWSADLPTLLFLETLLTREALMMRWASSTGYTRSILSSGGTVTDLGNTDPVVAAPNGDVLVTALPPTGPETVSRVTPAGSVAWQVSLDAWVTSIVAAGDRAALTTSSGVHLVDAAGTAVPWIPGPQGGLYVPLLPRVMLGPVGPFYVVDQGLNASGRVHRVAPGGVTLWHETLDGASSAGAVTDDGALSLVVTNGDTAARVFAP
jgi:hypothetical protein